MTADASKPTKPAHTIRRFGLKATIWRNEGEKGPWYTVSPSRSYKQGEEWKESNSYGSDELLVLGKMLDEADTWITQQQQAERQAA